MVQARHNLGLTEREKTFTYKHTRNTYDLYIGGETGELRDHNASDSNLLFLCLLLSALPSLC